MPDWSGNKLSKKSRLLNKKQFDRVFSRSQKVSNHYFTVLLHYHQKVETGPKARLGLIVSRKVDKRAVVRNRIKRIIRESFRRQKKLTVCDVVVIARPAASKGSNKTLFSSLDVLWQQAAEKLTQRRKET